MWVKRLLDSVGQLRIFLTLTRHSPFSFSHYLCDSNDRTSNYSTFVTLPHYLGPGPRLLLGWKSWLAQHIRICMLHNQLTAWCVLHPAKTREKKIGAVVEIPTRTSSKGITRNCLKRQTTEELKARRSDMVKHKSIGFEKKVESPIELWFRLLGPSHQHCRERGGKMPDYQKDYQKEDEMNQMKCKRLRGIDDHYQVHDDGCWMIVPLGKGKCFHLGA